MFPVANIAVYNACDNNWQQEKTSAYLNKTEDSCGTFISHKLRTNSVSKNKGKQNSQKRKNEYLLYCIPQKLGLHPEDNEMH